ncbi:MAG: hypothetical protein DMD69_10300 [Gemmatimonadetes bacterium]|nr:MAG: hypothetical protein DMD69_10300 [Gemmatimonadota bacterium]
MPLTAKLSREFYDKFGNAVVDELVNWFNQVDATYKLELRDLNELNFARFDAKLEQRIAELRAELRTGLASLEARFEAKLEQRIAELRGEIATLEGRLLARLGVVEGRFGTLEGRLVRWMFLFWVASLGTSIALIELGR